MGLLSETKIRRKASKDPNNTKWSRDTTTFGQKILRSQGWQPGEYLGAKDAAHSNFHTAANASYIRVALKDDMKGLGFDKARDNEVTGLDVFSDLLGRLNGKSEAIVEGERAARMVTKTNIYVERRWGPMRFVKGGLLVGDELKEVKEEDEKSEIPPEDVSIAATVTDDNDKEKKSKKRKALSVEDDDDASAKDASSKKRQRKEERKSKKSRSEPTPTETDEAARTRDTKKSKKEKKSKKDKSRSKDDADASESDERAKKRKSKSKDKKERSKGLDDDETESRKSKKERKEKKREEKRRRKAAAEGSGSESDSPGQSTSVSTRVSTPAGSGTATPRGDRNFVRSRFIAQKKQAFMDTKALNQIFMLKA